MLWWQLLGVFTLLAHWLACGMFWSGGYSAPSQWRLCFPLVLLLRVLAVSKKIVSN
jgi:hypothetical protein